MSNIGSRCTGIYIYRKLLYEKQLFFLLLGLSNIGRKSFYQNISFSSFAARESLEVNVYSKEVSQFLNKYFHRH